MSLRRKHQTRPDIIVPGDRACAGAVLSRRFLSGSCNPLDDMRDFGISDLHGDCGQAAADVARLLMPTHGGEGLRDGFVERFRRHVQRMRGIV